MYLKIQQFLPRYLELFQKTIKEFNLELNVVTKKGKNKISNFDYYQNFETNYEFLVIDEHKQADFIFAFFVLSRKGQTFYLNLPFFSQFLDKNWINIIGEFILDFIEENYHFETFYVQISNLGIKINNFFQKFAISFDGNSNTFKFNLVKRYEFIDIHCHPFSEYFQDSKAQVDNWFKKNIGLIFVVGTSWEYLEEIKKIGNYSKKIYKIIGIHPTLVAANDNFSLLENHIDDKVLAIGEVGLDFYYENNPPKEVQIKALLDQIQIAKSKKIPVMLHIRDKSGENQAMKLISEIVTKFSEINFIFHNFSTNYEIFQKLVKKNNCFFSFSGVITFKKSIELRRIIKETPLEKIFTETDVPYLSPEPNRQLWPNVSPQIQWTYQTIANLKNLTKIELSEIIYRNVRKIFKVKNAKTGS